MPGAGCWVRECRVLCGVRSEGCRVLRGCRVRCWVHEALDTTAPRIKHHAQHQALCTRTRHEAPGTQYPALH